MSWVEKTSDAHSINLLGQPENYYQICVLSLVGHQLKEIKPDTMAFNLTCFALAVMVARVA